MNNPVFNSILSLSFSSYHFISLWVVSHQGRVQNQLFQEYLNLSVKRGLDFFCSLEIVGHSLTFFQQQSQQGKHWMAAEIMEPFVFFFFMKLFEKWPYWNMIFLFASIDSCVSGSWSLSSVMENRGVTTLGCPKWLMLRDLNGGGDPGSMWKLKIF